MKLTILTSALFISVTAPALSDPIVGFGLSLSFNSGKPDAGVALRLLSDNEKGKIVGSIGVDYMFRNKEIHPTAGAAYLGKDSFIGPNIGYGLGGGGLAFGISAGVAKTRTKTQAAAPAVTWY